MITRPVQQLLSTIELSSPFAAVALSVLGTLLPVVGIVAAGVWVYDDARDRDAGAPGWLAVGSVVVPLVLAGYLLWVALGRMGERTSSPGRREQVAGTLGFGCLLAFFAGALVAPPDPITGTVYGLVALVPALAVAAVLVRRPGPPDTPN